MIFSSALYFFFFSGVFLIHWGVWPLFFKGENLRTARHVGLLIASYIFFSSYEWTYSFLLILFTLIAYLSAFVLEPVGALSEYPKRRKALLFLTVSSLVGMLVYYKYYNFFLGNLITLLGFVQIKPDFYFHTIALPLGISFFTFQALSYVIDVWRGKTPVERSLLRFALFKSFFPQLVAGPIVTAREFLPQLYKDRELDLERLRSGARWFALGFFKKAVIADNVSPSVDMLFLDPGHFTSGGAWLAAAGFSAQLYADFSGYSDMAWGSAIWLGFDLPENFRMPYMARSITDHWRRWHMSLARWIREYVYISMGGNRVSFIRHKVNLFFSFIVSGLWHGANWTYVVWGTSQGVILVIENILKGLTEKKEGGAEAIKQPGIFSKILWWPTQLVLWLYMIIFTTSSHVVFRSPSLAQSWTHLKSMYGFGNGSIAPQPSVYKPILLSVAVVLLGQWFGYWYFEKNKFRFKIPLWLEFAFYPLMVLALIQLSAPEGGAFIYFVF